MSSDNEYVALLKYAIHLNIDLSTFPTVWDVLFILLNTQESNLEYVKLLQEEYNRYYESISRQYMENLEKKSTEIQNCMHDNVTHMSFIEFQITMAMTQPHYTDNKSNSLKLLIVQKIPLNMMQLTY